MASSYKNFKELAAHEVRGKDFRIRTKTRSGPFLIMAFHGGKIEPGTTGIAEAVAGNNHSFYGFEGLKEPEDENDILHIPSHRFDEPRALRMVDRADIVIAIHGQSNTKNQFLAVGGLDKALCFKIKRQLEMSGFKISAADRGLRGNNPMNIVNRGQSRGGVQLELSRKLRDSLHANAVQRRSFSRAVRKEI